MTRYVALLGSINVGGNRLKMADLRVALKGEGFANAATVVASGNVLFDQAIAPDAKLEAQIVEVVKARFGIDSFAAVRSADELRHGLSESPFADQGEHKLVHVHFLACQPGAAAFARLAADHAGRGEEKLAAGTRCLHLDFTGGVANSRLTAAFMEKRLGCRGTARNLRSIRRIIEAMEN